MDITNVGKFLRDARKAKGLTQLDVAEHLGVSAQAVSKWERGGNLPDVAFFPDISRILEIGIEEMLGAGTAHLDNQIQADTNDIQRLVDNKLFDSVLARIKRVASVVDLNLELDFFVYLSSRQKTAMIEALLAMRGYEVTLDEILPYTNAAHKSLIVNHILVNRDYALLEQITTYMSNEMKAAALEKLLNEGCFDIIEDIMPAFNRRHRDQIVDFFGVNPPDIDTIENFLPFFDINQVKRLKADLIKEEEQ